MIEPLIDTIKENELATMDNLTLERRAYWLDSIESDMRNMNQLKKYITLETIWTRTNGCRQKQG